jgi:hypothetical protein
MTMTHEEANELLAALAIDAVDDAERAAILAHVAECPRCQSELDAMREVASALGNSVEPLPEGLWSSISERIYEVRNEEVPPLPRLLPVGFSEIGTDAIVVPITSRRLKGVFASIGAVAAAAIIVLAFSLASASHHVNQLQDALKNAANNAVTAALETPGHRVVELKGPDQEKLAQFVLLPDGRGYMVRSELPTLKSNETYQLWGVIDGKAISIGLIGTSPQHVTFTDSGPSSPTVLGVTVEPAGGSPTPTSSMVASATV